MSVPDPKTAAVARAQFNDLGPNAAGATGGEVNLNMIMDVSVTLALEVGRADRKSTRLNSSHPVSSRIPSSA